MLQPHRHVGQPPLARVCARPVPQRQVLGDGRRHAAAPAGLAAAARAAAAASGAADRGARCGGAGAAGQLHRGLLRRRRRRRRRPAGVAGRGVRRQGGAGGGRVGDAAHPPDAAGGCGLGSRPAGDRQPAPAHGAAQAEAVRHRRRGATGGRAAAPAPGRARAGGLGCRGASQAGTQRGRHPWAAVRGACMLDKAARQLAAWLNTGIGPTQRRWPA